MFDERDDSTGEASAIVSESLARKFFGSADPLERRIRLTAEDGSGPWLSVVGVVKDVRKTFSDTLYPDIYRPFAQEPRAYVALMCADVHASHAAGIGVRAAVMAENEALALSDVEPMSAVIASRRAQAGMLALFVGGVGVLALIVTTAGLYAVVGYLVRLRRREFAVRIALGAEAGRIIRAVLEQARWMVVAGIVAGIALALGPAG
jgi:ABC-type antimicrobial peptide transport system permease subunit